MLTKTAFIWSKYNKKTVTLFNIIAIENNYLLTKITIYLFIYVCMYLLHIWMNNYTFRLAIIYWYLWKK